MKIVWMGLLTAISFSCFAQEKSKVKPPAKTDSVTNATSFESNAAQHIDPQPVDSSKMLYYVVMPLQDWGSLISIIKSSDAKYSIVDAAVKYISDRLTALPPQPAQGKPATTTPPKNK